MEGHIALGVNVSELYQRRELVFWDLSLCGPEIAGPSSYYPLEMQKREWMTNTIPLLSIARRVSW